MALYDGSLTVALVADAPSICEGETDVSLGTTDLVLLSLKLKALRPGSGFVSVGYDADSPTVAAGDVPSFGMLCERPSFSLVRVSLTNGLTLSTSVVLESLSLLEVAECRDILSLLGPWARFWVTSSEVKDLVRGISLLASRGGRAFTVPLD